MCEACQNVHSSLSFQDKVQAAILEKNVSAVRSLTQHSPEDLLKIYARENPKMLSEVLNLDSNEYASILEKVSELGISASAFGLLVKDSCGLTLAIAEASPKGEYHILLYQPEGVSCDNRVILRALEAASLNVVGSTFVQGKGSSSFAYEYCLTMASLMHHEDDPYNALGNLSSETVAEFLSEILGKSEK